MAAQIAQNRPFPARFRHPVKHTATTLGKTHEPPALWTGGSWWAANQSR